LIREGNLGEDEWGRICHLILVSLCSFAFTSPQTILAPWDRASCTSSLFFLIPGGATRIGAGESLPYMSSIVIFNAAVKSSTMDSCTRIRSVDMQTWPLWMNAPSMQPRAALSRSASCSTMAGALPPSSISTGLRALPAVAATMLPMAVLPV